MTSESISSKDGQSCSSSSDRGLDSIDRLNPTNVYDQIYYDNIQSNPSVNSSMMKFSELTPPYTPSYSSDDVSIDHYYYRLPSPSSTLIDQDTTTPNRSIISSTSNTKRELHKELIYRQKMGQLLPKKPELFNVFKSRRAEEKKREDERKRERSSLEQILARQRQKIDQTDNVCSLSGSESAHSNEFEFVYHRICQGKTTK